MTPPVRLTAAAYGLGRRIAEEHSIAFSGAVEAALRGWDMLSREQQAECLGVDRVPPWWETDLKGFKPLTEM